ncbi:hypothetical protein VTN77DRAFT_3884 [Rasamsonia byssochlamydoides]|uniref:uncharacterized protein n=1 Tax=Rasamsonia byssochlamydoides TaxID=89139 RepID=UPI00374291AE
MTTTVEPPSATPGSESAAPPQQPPKFSRYRSVRQAAKAQLRTEASPSLPAPAPPNTSQKDDVAAKPKNETIARSTSRYRRARPAATATATATTPAPVPSVPPVPKQQMSPPAVDYTPQADAQEKKLSREFKQDLVPEKNATNKVQSRQVEDDDESELSPEEKERLRREAMEQLTMAERQPARARDSSRSRVPQGHRQKTPVKRREERQPAQETSESKRHSWKEKLGLRPKTAAEGRQPDTTRKDPSRAKNIEPGGRGIVPGIDAPISAVNSGERRVLVKCNSSSISLPVTPTTRAKDIIFSALNCLSEPDVDPKTAILLESFSQLGLERPLRRYEHIRDVLNSWATDTQNFLVITPLPFDGAGEKLEVQAAPREQPKEATFSLYHSQKPGKWDKRYVTLRSDGQVVVSKKPDGKESTNICHLSDFDIYSPTQRQLKKLKPPKKQCFAVKSQQKSSMFLSTENFVHFFATNDADLAQSLYDAVHSWRSWYLVSVLGEGQKQKDVSNITPGDLSRSASRHRRNSSTDSTPYQLGSFEPLVDLGSVGRNEDTSAASANKNAGEAPASSSQEIYLRKKLTRGHAPPPSSFPMSLAVDTDDAHAEVGKSASPEDDDATFSPTGLLGRTYSLRKEAQRKREAELARENAEGPFISGGLLKNLGSSISPSSSHNNLGDPSSRQPSRSNTMRSTHDPEFARSNSNRDKQKPLVDLTPVFREPPQHSRKGHGVKVSPGVPLVEAATGPEISPGAIAIPPATTWRRPEPQSRPTTSKETSSASVSARRRANSTRSQHQAPQTTTTTTNLVSELSSPVSPDNPFTPSSLLALSTQQTAASYSATGTGRGVATGDRHAGRPLLDMTPKSQFAEGSLLRSLERGL